ncbi:vacuolar protein sorting-associated protein 54, chloroplastic isoform X2 [Rhodamnia argentea]|uniref:Vacuolar protein sorting-associated protein 54, chloroplastic isoform X2 n=1 Tax=Rhodamnia argentea TaxID=178133 RepID=A0A8B8MUL4_9MYRT|nr:vacuolar protein sorting-associated protein 54, chloroplastic isoform X2 [Rhodamnia argentea]
MDSQPSPSSGRSPSSDFPRNASSSSFSLSSRSLSDAALARPADPSWVGWWSSSTSIAVPDFAPLASRPSSDLSRSDFLPYLSSISEPFHRFEDIRDHSSRERDLQGGAGADESEVAGGQGDALVACLREVPALYFKEDFALEEGATFRAACPFSSIAENSALQEKLSHYLDVVELHLVKEISLRSNSFFEAQGQLQDLNVKILRGCGRIRELKETIRLLDGDLVDSARQIQELNATRGNLLRLQQKLRLILSVNQAVSALELLVASADCAGALDVIDDLRHLLEGDELTGLHCFRHLWDHVAASIDSINSILSAEFMRTSVHDVGDMDVIILSKVKARASISVNGAEDEIKFNEEETLNLRDRLLPIVIGLLRTAKLPSVLRIYRDMLTADMKTAIKTTVAELLPVLVARPAELDFTPGERTNDGEGGGSSLASKLRSLSSECFVQLLGAIFSIVRVHLVRAAEVKKANEWILCNLDDHYAANSVAAAIALDAAAAETAEDTDGQIGSILPYLAERNGTTKLPTFQGKANECLSPSAVSKSFRADVLRENAEAIFAACDAAHARWAKLLGVRALLHPRLRLQEFLSIHSLTQEFISATEKIGGRLGYSIRGTLQSQAKSFVDFQHESRMAKIKAVLDQETWVEVDVPDEFQAIINALFCTDSLHAESIDASEVSMVAGNDVSNEAAAGLPLTQQETQAGDFAGVSSENSDRGISSQLTSNSEKNKADINSSSQVNNSTVKERGKSSSQSLIYRGVGYHMVNCGLILVKMLSEYIDMNNYLPTLSSEVVLRVVEILKHFNTRTCQLVLGAHAMQVSGLKSITSKHLALASQVISFIHAVIPGVFSS